MLTEQGAFAVSSGGSGGCWYRNPEGHKCALGIHIPDEIYTEKMEGHWAVGLLMRYPTVKDVLERKYGAFGDGDIHFIGNVQSFLHDQPGQNGEPLPTIEQVIQQLRTAGMEV
jgi:hypothetical protein